MRCIRKNGDGGYLLVRANSNPPQTANVASSRWRAFSDKNNVIGYLLTEQFWLCCYSELRADTLGLGYHIEHVENKFQCPQRTFDYANLAASALSSASLKGGVSALQTVQQPCTIFGGHAPGKQSAVDMQRFVSPHELDCARFFAYLSDGRIVPAENLTEADVDRAQYTIDLLNLNSPYLLVYRRRWWSELDDIYRYNEDNEMDLSCLAIVDLVPCRGFLNNFFTLTRQFYGRIAEEVLRGHAANLL